MYERKLLTSSLAVLAAAAAVATVAAAPDRKPPRIVSAAMQDRDGDARADGVKLTYSERVRHARDTDGKYPFRVSGYRIRSVSRASARTILITLVERATPDAAARPAIAYRRTRQGAVSDRARNQALAQVFRATKAHGRSPSTPAPAPAPPSPAPVGDRDGDGTPDAQDCAPDDPKIHPKAADLPDLAFVDSNCDGIDGDEANAIFVSPEGKDGNPGTKAQPKREIDAAVADAAGKGEVVLAAAGSYGKVNAARGVGIYGGYDPKSWKRSFDGVTSITGAPEAFLAIQARKVVLQLLTVRGVTTVVPGTSAYGIRALSSELTLQRVTVHAGNGSYGVGGALGAKGAPGGPGDPGGKGQCDGAKPGAGGTGGTSPVGRPGGSGGLGGRLTPGELGKQGQVGTPGGSGGKAGDPGKDGNDGTPGTSGVHGANGDGAGSSGLVDVTWQGRRGGDGTVGGPGNGGGGGGGGGPQICLLCLDGSGNGGGGGGGGGAGGTGGTGGSPGGGSFGLYLYDSTVAVTHQSSIAPGAGGRGGNGADGELGGQGGDGGKGATYCTSEIGEGGNGGRGGDGGRGGGGGGGAGGPSIGIFMVSGSKATTSADSTVRSGDRGLGGSGGMGGTGPARQGATGRAAPIAKP